MRFGSIKNATLLAACLALAITLAVGCAEKPPAASPSGGGKMAPEPIPKPEPKPQAPMVKPAGPARPAEVQRAEVKPAAHRQAKPAAASPKPAPKPAPASPRLACPANGKQQAVTAVGVAPIFKGNKLQARAEALTDARVRAVEQAAGVTVDSRAVLHLELLADSSVDLKTHGTILSEKVLKEWADQAGMYRLELRATVCKNRVAERVAGLLRPDRVVVAVAESGLRGRLVAALNKAGFQRIEVADCARCLGANGAGAAYRLGRRHMADLVIVGQVASKPSSKIRDAFYAAHGGGWLQVFRAKEKRMMSADVASAVRGFGQNMDAAMEQARTKTGERLMAQAMKALTGRHVRDLQVEVRGLPDLNAFKRVKSQLALTRWVQKVEGAKFASGIAVFELRYADNPEMLATFLDRLPGYKVDGFSDNKVIIKYAP